MSMPSDVTPDITDALESQPARVVAVGKRMRQQLTGEQLGLAAAAAIAFLGVAIIGPALARIGRPKPLSRRLEDRARDVRQRVGEAGDRARQAGAEANERAYRAATKAHKRAKKQVRRLGGGSVWR